MDSLPREIIEMILLHTVGPSLRLTHLWRLRSLGTAWRRTCEHLLTRVLLRQELKMRVTYILPAGAANAGATFAPDSWLVFSHYDPETRSLHFIPPHNSKAIHVGWHPLPLSHISPSARYLPTVDLVGAVVRKGDEGKPEICQLGSPFRLFQIPLPASKRSIPAPDHHTTGSIIAAQGTVRNLLSTEASLSYSFGPWRTITDTYASDILHPTSTGLHSLDPPTGRGDAAAAVAAADIDTLLQPPLADTTAHALQVSCVTLAVGRVLRLLHPECFERPPFYTSTPSAVADPSPNSSASTENTHSRVQYSHTNPINLIDEKKLKCLLEMVRAVGLDTEPIRLHLNVEARWYWSHGIKDGEVCALCDAECDEWMQSHRRRRSSASSHVSRNRSGQSPVGTLSIASHKSILASMKRKNVQSPSSSSFPYVQFEELLNSWLVQSNGTDGRVDDETIRGGLRELALWHRNKARRLKNWKSRERILSRMDGARGRRRGMWAKMLHGFL
ncbi:hypothetical protein SeMB42_g02365 [Synchytrium endobioticum]|uniref:Uncharacterized protein n=1 Tax=Synchytrium endobioticum TaxID=286115 RepID=A0A507DEG6_9FUNG|nr:hypothetical protein SeLEV6574_g02694 [Synchytrium endobioticum]TPX50089.1 hypothetical protein SeMB42_g02365 [Synchytrium endobioticum]